MYTFIYSHCHLCIVSRCWRIMAWKHGETLTTTISFYRSGSLEWLPCCVVVPTSWFFCGQGSMTFLTLEAHFKAPSLLYLPLFILSATSRILTHLSRSLLKENLVILPFCPFPQQSAANKSVILPPHFCVHSLFPAPGWEEKIGGFRANQFPDSDMRVYS